MAVKLKFYGQTQHRGEVEKTLKKNRIVLFPTEPEMAAVESSALNELISRSEMESGKRQELMVEQRR
jgi:hypothetical protein